MALFLRDLSPQSCLLFQQSLQTQRVPVQLELLTASLQLTNTQIRANEQNLSFVNHEYLFEGSWYCHNTGFFTSILYIKKKQKQNMILNIIFYTTEKKLPQYWLKWPFLNTILYYFKYFSKESNFSNTKRQGWWSDGGLTSSWLWSRSSAMSCSSCLVCSRSCMLWAVISFWAWTRSSTVTAFTPSWERSGRTLCQIIALRTSVD